MFAVLSILIGFILLFWGGVIGTSVGFFGERVANIPSMIIGGVLIIFGMLIFIATKSNDSEEKNQEKQEKFDGTKDINDDRYKIFLTKKYAIEKNDVLNKFICNEKLFGTVEEALNYAMLCDEKNEKLQKNPVTKPEICDSTCPNCGAEIYHSDSQCWKCSALYEANSTWKPIRK